MAYSLTDEIYDMVRFVWGVVQVNAVAIFKFGGFLLGLQLVEQIMNRFIDILTGTSEGDIAKANLRKRAAAAVDFSEAVRTEKARRMGQSWIRDVDDD